MSRFVSILLLPFFVVAQDSSYLKNFDYRRADSIALNFPKKKYKTVAAVAEVLTENLQTEHEKFRAIFRWITDNIEYNKSAGGMAQPYQVLRRNKAVCQGFSLLLKEMCDIVSIPCEVITGYTKTDVSDINRRSKKTDHAWNCVKLYGKWYLVDVTWATSKFNIVTRKFQKEFDEYYYIVPPETFILDHYPAPPTKMQAQQILAGNRHARNLRYYFQFLDKPVRRKDFASWPLYYPEYFHLGLDGIVPQKGAFAWKLERPLLVEFESARPISEAAVLVFADKYIAPVTLRKTGETHYAFEYTFPDKGKTSFTVYANGLCVAEYLVEVK